MRLFPKKESDSIAAAAAAWLARCDRGLSPAEQDALLQWMSEDPRHRAAFGREEKSWAKLDALGRWQPLHSARPNPDLLAPPRRRRRAVFAGAFAAGLAAAAAVAIMFTNTEPKPGLAGQAMPGLRVIPRPEQLKLPDGSTAALDHGGRFELAFTASERRVRLLEGELYVTVAKNPAVPFVVEVDGLTVRAVGTAFNVRRGRETVDVLVTEGQVQLERIASNATPAAHAVPLASGHRARIDLAQPESRPQMSAVSAADIDRELAWRGVRLEFDALPLAGVVKEFNLRNTRQLAIGDTEAGQLRVAGTFRADEVEAFVLLLEASFGIAVDRRAEGPWVLRRGAGQP